MRPVVAEYELENEEGSTTENLTGQVISVRDKNGYLVWRIRFGNEEEEGMQVERFARCSTIFQHQASQHLSAKK